MKGILTKKCKLGQRGGDVVILFLTTFRILGSLHISGTVEVINFKHVHKSVQIK